MTLKTRKPTGAVPWPLILLEGGEKSGKTFSCAVLTGSAKVGRSAWLDLNEGSGDEYGLVPGARYDMIDHDGTWPSILREAGEAKKEAQADADAGKPPFVLVVDTMSAEWDMHKAWAEARAKGSDFNKKKLAQDPNAEIQIPMNLWNDANARHRRLMTILMTFPGIVVVTARGKDVAALDEKGRPIEGTKEYKVEGNKNLAYDVSCWVRMYRDQPAVIVGARSVHAGIRPGKDEPRRLDPDWTLEGLIFDVLRCDPANTRARELTELRAVRTPQAIRDEALSTTTDFARIRELHAEARELGYGDGDTVVTDTQELEPLLAFLKRIGDAKLAEERGTRPAGAAQAPAGPPVSEEAWVLDFAARLADTDTDGDEGIAARRAEINKALAEKIIAPRTASELHGEVNRRKAQASQAVAA